MVLVSDFSKFRNTRAERTASAPAAFATVSVANYEGDFETEFPVTLRGARGHRLDFVLGNGSATLVLESFEGDVKLLRRR